MPRPHGLQQPVTVSYCTFCYGTTLTTWTDVLVINESSTADEAYKQDRTRSRIDN
ncbi:hypothetical protein MBANPS3_005695, partial [Mucor bainieri]